MMQDFTEVLSTLARSPLLWITLTLLVYLAAVWLYRRSGLNPFLIPVLTAVSVIIAVLKLSATPYPVYFEGTKFIHFFVGPVIVALAVPLFSQITRLRQIWLPVSVALIAGSGTAAISAVLIAWALGGSVTTLISLAPKSATMPIAMALTERFHGLVPLAAVAVAVTGIGGTIIARPLLNLLRIQDPAVRGFALGLTAHAIGTARALQHNPTAGAFAALAMALNGVATALLVPLIFWFFHRTGLLF